MPSQAVRPMMCVRAVVEAELLLLVLRVDGQAEAELPVLGALVGEKAVERVHEHPRNQLPHDQNSMVSVVWRLCLPREHASPDPRGNCGMSPTLQTPLP